MAQLAVAVDLGGTSIKLGLVTLQGDIIAKRAIPTPTKRGDDAIVHAIAQGVEELIATDVQGASVLGIGIGVPGFLDYAKGIVTLAPNIDWHDYPAQAKLTQKLRMPVALENDANCAALGERWRGAGRGVQSLVLTTIGTGVGGGIVIDGRIVRGKDGIGGELGHITVRPDGLLCGCGKHGCLETEASATAIRRKAMERLRLGEASLLQHLWKQHGDITPRQVVEAAQAGDALATTVFTEVAHTLALVLSNIAHTLNPEKILIGGGISHAGEPLFTPLRHYFDRYTLATANYPHMLAPATLGNDAGMLGAAYALFQSMEVW